MLSAHDCVIIPNFGAFIADYKPAVVSDEQSTIPKKDILFNRNLTRNDGLLINALIEERGLSYPEAKQEIERYVAYVNVTLAKGEKINFAGIGKLTLDEAGFIQFVADEHNSCLLDAYGLQPIHLNKINQQEAPLIAVDEEVKVHRSTRIVLRVASVAAVVVLLLLFTTPLTDRHVSGDYASLGFDNSTPEVVTNSAPVTELKATSKPVSTDEVKAAKTLSSSSIIVEPAFENLPSPVVLQKTYHIIIASLATEEIAKEYVTTFKLKYDFDSVEMLSSIGRHRISVAHFNQQKEAVAFVKSLRLLNPKFGDAWVLPQTLN